MSTLLLKLVVITVLLLLVIVGQARYASAEKVAVEEGRFVKLHATRWTIDGNPILGTYGAPRVEDLRRVKDAGMNVVLAGDDELDPTTPVGAFCLEGPDLMLTADLYDPGPGGFESVVKSRRAFTMAAVFRDASLYDIPDLDWSMAGIRAELADFRGYFYYRDYGIDDLYNSTHLEFRLERSVREHFMIGVGLGMTATAIKIIVGIERTYLGRGA